MSKFHVLTFSVVFLFLVFLFNSIQAQMLVRYTFDKTNRITTVDNISTGVLSFTYDELGNRNALNVKSNSCPSTYNHFYSNLPGTKFQWQVKVDSAATFTPISDNSFYYGTRIDSLIIMNPSTAMVGYKYRCAVTLDGVTSYSPEYELRIKAIWKGGADSAWLNPANWECGLVPAEKIDVIIPKGTYSPVLAQDAKVESVLLKDGEVLRVAPGVKLEITGKPKQ